MSSYICSVFLGKWGCITGRGGSVCEDDGTIWYGTQAGKVKNCAKNVIDEKIRQFQYPCWNRYGSWQYRLQS